MKTILWRGIAFSSLEYFNIQENDEHYHVRSKVIGYFQENIYSVTYQLTINKLWEITTFHIDAEVNAVQHILTGKKIDANWEINQYMDKDFEGYQYIDISLSPFTNTLPINNLKLEIGESKEISVIYIDLISNTIKPVLQRYTKTAPDEYLYENIISDFSTHIQVDKTGLILNYPGLFKMIASH